MEKKEASTEQHEDEIHEINVDEALEITGGFGRYQVLLQFAVGAFLLCSGYQTMLLYFTADSPSWRCTRNATEPFCDAHKHPITVSSEHFAKRCAFNRGEWEFTTSARYSLVTEYDLVCDRRSIQALITSVFYVGWAVAGVFVGFFADHYGRKLVLILTTILLIVSSVAGAFVVEIWQIILVRVLIGAGYGSANSCAFILLAEFVVERYRSVSANLYQLPFFFSAFLLTACAYYVRDWRKVTLYTSLPGTTVLFVYIALPNSPRWLISVQKNERAREVLESVGKINRQPLLAHLSVVNKQTLTKTYSYLDFFRHCTVFTLLVNQTYMWFTAGMVYFGLNYAASSLGGDMHLNLFLLTLVDLLATALCIALLKRFGRKKTICGSCVVSALFLFGIAAIPESFKYLTLLKTIFAMIGKCFISLAFNAIYLWSFGLFPTVVRSQGFIICQIAGRLGSVAAPFIVDDLTVYWIKLPYVVFAVFACIASVICLFLPETSNRPTRERYEDFFDVQVF